MSVQNCPTEDHWKFQRWEGGGRGGLRRPMFFKEGLRSQYGLFCGTIVDVHEGCTGPDLG